MVRGADDLDLQVQIKLKGPNLLHFEPPVCAISHHPFLKAGLVKSRSKVQNTLLGSLLFGGVIDFGLQGQI